MGDEVARAIHAFWIEAVGDHFEDGNRLAVEPSGAYQSRGFHIGKPFVGGGGGTGVCGTALVWQRIRWRKMIDLMGIGVDDFVDMVEAAYLLSSGYPHIEHRLGREGQDMRKSSRRFALADTCDDEGMAAFVDGKGGFVLFSQPQSLDDWSCFRRRRAVDDHSMIISPLGSAAKLPHGPVQLHFWIWIDTILHLGERIVAVLLPIHRIVQIVLILVARIASVFVSILISIVVLEKIRAIIEIKSEKSHVST